MYAILGPYSGPRNRTVCRVKLLLPAAVRLARKPWSSSACLLKWGLPGFASGCLRQAPFWPPGLAVLACLCSLLGALRCQIVLATGSFTKSRGRGCPALGWNLLTSARSAECRRQSFLVTPLSFCCWRVRGGAWLCFCSGASLLGSGRTKLRRPTGAICRAAS